MPPQSDERRTAVGRMFQRYQSAVTERCFFYSDAFYCSRKGGIKWRPRGHKQIQTQMMGASIAFNEPRLKGDIRVDTAFLAPGADAKLYSMGVAEIVPPFGCVTRTFFSGCNGHLMIGITIWDN